MKKKNIFSRIGFLCFLVMLCLSCCVTRISFAILRNHILLTSEQLGIEWHPGLHPWQAKFTQIHSNSPQWLAVEIYRTSWIVVNYHPLSWSHQARDVPCRVHSLLLLVKDFCKSQGYFFIPPPPLSLPHSHIWLCRSGINSLHLVYFIYKGPL